MGKKDRQQRGHSKNRGGNSRFNKERNDSRGKSGSRGKSRQNNMNKHFNKNISKKNDRRAETPTEIKRNKPNKGQKNGKGGEYSHLLGKSIFKIIPEGQNEKKKDKFAALNGDQEEQEENYQQGQENQEQYQQGQEQDNMQQNQQQQMQNEGDEQELQNQQQQQNQFEGNAEDDQYEGEQQQQYEQQQNNEQKVEDVAKKQQEQEPMPMGQQQQQDQNVDISVINLRIQQTLQVLMNINKLGQGKSRKHFVDKLKSYVHRYYGYNFQLIDHFLNFLNPTEMIQFFQANETQRPLTIRTNTLKIRRKELAQFLIQRGVNLDPLAEWSKVGIKIYETKVPIGATPEYLAGYYMLQSASSLLPVLALDPQMNEKILDMASAPGGKTSYIAQIMKNTGAVFANDLKKERLKALQFNLYRLGITNTVVTCRDGRKYPQIFPNTFDRVLLDAPCTGLGIISKDHSIKANRVLLDIYKNSHVQKQLLLAAIDCTKVGGVVVYSTCSVSPLENQQVINYALKKRHVKLVDVDDLVEVGEPGLIKFIDKRYHVDLKKTKRIYPHIHNMDGFYFGKLVKTANGKKEAPKGQVQEQQ